MRNPKAKIVVDNEKAFIKGVDPMREPKSEAE